MPKARTDRIKAFKAAVLARLDDGFHRPGQRFLSTRALAARYDVSFQTAHRVVSELVAEGRLVRRPGAGTFIAGEPAHLHRVLLVFHPRARRAESFGAHLLERLTTALEAAGIPHEVTFSANRRRIPEDAYPVFWETPEAARAVAADHRYALLLNDSPPPGIAGSYTDAVTTDNYSGGLCAAEVLTGCKPVAVVAGPRDDQRSRQRVEGFHALRPEARVFYAESWDAAAGRAAVARLPTSVRGCFCVNDRIASGVLEGREQAGRSMAVVGFDDAPLAEALGLTTVAIPWESLVAGAVTTIQRRLDGDTSTARQQIFAPRPVLRQSHRQG